MIASGHSGAGYERTITLYRHPLLQRAGGAAVLWRGGHVPAGHGADAGFQDVQGLL